MELLLVRPDHFQIRYAINPFMESKIGSVDSTRAILQWETLKKTFESLNIPVHVLDADSNLPDMVFAANQSFQFRNPKTNTFEVLLSEMRSPKRKPEVAHFKNWYESHGWQTHSLQSNAVFEGTGDALYDPFHDWVIGASGPRTDAEVYDEMEARLGLKIARVELVTADFYHLDTCFSLLDATTIAYVPDAFDTKGRETLQGLYPRCIVIDTEEALKYFAGNCFCPNGKDVVLEKGPKKFVTELKSQGFQPWELETTEFIKSGGSVFCLKMVLY